MPPPAYPPSGGMHRTMSGESEYSLTGRPTSGYQSLGRTLLTASPQQHQQQVTRASPYGPSIPPHAAMSSPSLPPAGSYFPTHYSANPSPSATQNASPRTSISHLLTPSEPPRSLPTTSTFAFTPGHHSADTRELSQTRYIPGSRGSIQGWTNTDDPAAPGMIRKITPTGGALTAMMNPTPSPAPVQTPTPPVVEADPPETPMTRTPPLLNSVDQPVEAGAQRRKASEQEMSAAEALSALAGGPTTPARVSEDSGVPVAREQPEEAEKPKPSPQIETRPAEEIVSPKSAPVDVADPPPKRKRSKAEGSEATPTPRKRKASAVAETDEQSVNGKPKKRTGKERANGTVEPVVVSAEPAPAVTAYNPRRISEPRSILNPITRDELAYIRNPRNIRNPLKTGRPRVIVPQDEPYPVDTRSMEPVTDDPPVIERGGDKRGQAGRGREERPPRDSRGEPPARGRFDAQVKGHHVAEHCTCALHPWRVALLIRACRQQTR